MAQSIRVEKLAPADELRTLLDESEKLVANARGSGAGALALLENLDRLALLWPQLETAGADLRPEAGRMETLEAQVHRRAADIVRELGAAGGLPALRAERFRQSDAPWWWQLEREVRKGRLQRGRQTLVTLAAVLVLAALAYFAFNRLFPTDPQVAASAARLMSGQQAIQNEGDVQKAVADFQAAASLRPNDPEAWLWLGVGQQKLGQEAEAAKAFARAQQLLSNEVNFRLARAPVYVALDLPEQARADVDFVIARQPGNAPAHYYLASIYEAQGRLNEAIAELQKTSDLAEAGQEPELTAMARYRMAMLMQAMQARSLDATPTPTATP